MPNWTHNLLTLETPSETRLVEISQAILNVENELSFEVLVPVQKSDETEYKIDGVAVTWRTKHWGTKWDAAHPIVKDKTNTSIAIGFDTAWAPPLPWVNKLAEAFPECDVTLSCVDDGAEFSGYYLYSMGMLIDSQENSTATLADYQRVGLSENDYKTESGIEDESYSYATLEQQQAVELEENIARTKLNEASSIKKSTEDIAKSISRSLTIKTPEQQDAFIKAVYKETASSYEKQVRQGKIKSYTEAELYRSLATTIAETIKRNNAAMKHDDAEMVKDMASINKFLGQLMSLKTAREQDAIREAARETAIQSLNAQVKKGTLKSYTNRQVTQLMSNIISDFVASENARFLERRNKEIAAHSNGYSKAKDKSCSPCETTSTQRDVYEAQKSIAELEERVYYLETEAVNLQKKISDAKCTLEELKSVRTRTLRALNKIQLDPSYHDQQLELLSYSRELTDQVKEHLEAINMMQKTLLEIETMRSMAYTELYDMTKRSSAAAKPKKVKEKNNDYYYLNDNESNYSNNYKKPNKYSKYADYSPYDDYYNEDYD